MGKDDLRIQQFVLSLLIGFFFLFMPTTVYAEDAVVTFGSERYTKKVEEIFHIGVYLRAESTIGTYRVEIAYDADRMEYMGGADAFQDGRIILEGTGLGKEIKYMLRFQAVSGGEAGICVVEASVQKSEQDGGVDFDITLLGRAPIVITGEDTSADSFLERMQMEARAQQGEAEKTMEQIQEEKFGIATDIPLLTAVQMNTGEVLYLPDHAKYIPDNVGWHYQTVQGNFLGQPTVFLTNSLGTVKLLYLMDAGKVFSPFAYNEENQRMYPCQNLTVAGKDYLYMSAYASSSWPEELTMQAISDDGVFYTLDEEGKCRFCRFAEDGSLIAWKPEQSKTSYSTQNRNLRWVLAVAGTVLLATGLLAVIFSVDREKRRKRNRYVEQTDLFSEEKGQEFYYEDLDEEDSEYRTAQELPVISVQDVTMIFHISTSNASGLKEYLIQRLRHQVTTRELTALEHINFDVYKGEVVGIIGTNGSGKSTFLRIVSGALSPTMGQVLVDRRKLQLLTLGAGFDTELSAKENLYLNGSIIGYSKEFLDTHYEEIVSFAELQGFMEEKVKNFSSGMVSRLGFAIATAGETAEILILDEVLSVGDEFFRQKSLARIKEMIHGGSTVLMVSHGMSTILENCTKVVWIEKGKLLMMGEPKEVCEAYLQN